MVVFMGKSYESSLQAMDSSYHARIALQTTAQGVRPVIPMESQEVDRVAPVGFNDQPFTLLYLNGWVMRALGADAFSARLLPTAFAVGCVALLVWFGSLLYTPTIGLAAGFILILTREFIRFGARFQLDPAMIFFILLSFIAWWKRKPVWTGVAVGLGLWMKTPVVLLVFPSAVMASILSGTWSWKEFVKLVGAGVLALIIGSGIWILAGNLGGWEVVSDYWRRQVLGTALNGRGVVQATDYWMGFEVLRRTYYPWLPLLMVSIFLILKHQRWKDPAVALCLSASVIVMFVISMIRFKYFHYYLPMYPFLALLALDSVRKRLSERAVGFSKFLIATAIVAPTLILAFPIQLSPEMFPSLRRFNPIIQSYGKCRDKVLFVNGFQAYGGEQEYLAEVQFYTNRKVVGTLCGEAEKKVRDFNPEWIIVSGENKDKCLSESLRAPYSVTYQFGNQYLLSRIMDPKLVTDLTPLARDLKAPLDCEKVTYTKSPFFKDAL